MLTRGFSLAWLSLLVVTGFSQPAFAQPEISWTFAGPVGPAGRVLSLAVDPRNASAIYLAAPGGGVWKTQDGGAYWVPRMDAAQSLQVCSLAIDPSFPDVLYAGTGDNQSPRPGQGVARSADGGESWTFGPRFTNQPVCTLAVDPASSERIFAGSAEGLFLSSDAGASWSKILSSPITSIAFDSQNWIYAGMLGQDAPRERKNILARSSDGGLSWVSLALPSDPYASDIYTNWVSVIADAGSVSIAVSYQLTPLIPGSASAAQAPVSQLDFYRSIDQGSTWSMTLRIGSARPPVSLFSAPVSRNLYVAAATLLVSEDQGSNWLAIPTASAEFHTAVFTGATMLLGGERGLERVVLVQGATARAPSQLPVGQFLGVSPDSINGVWGAGPTGLYHSFPGTNLPDLRVSGIGAAGSVVIAAGTSNIFATGNSEIFRSTDGGSRFLASTVIASGELRAPFPPIVLDPVATSSAFVAGRRLYRTNDSGATWTALPEVDPDPTHVVIALAIAPASRSTFFAATACLPEVALISCPATSVIWRSANGGQTWVQRSLVSGLVNRLAVDPRQNNTLYAAIGAFPAGPSISAGFTPGDLLRSTDAAGAWLSVRSNLPQSPVNALVIDPASLPVQINQPAQTLYVGTDAGVFVSFNASAQWTDISGSLVRSLPSSPITDLSLGQSDGTLLASTFGRGIYRTSIAGLVPGIIVSPLSMDVTLAQRTATTTGVSFRNVSTTTTWDWRLNAVDSWIHVIESNGSLRPNASVQTAIRISAADLQPGNHLGRLKLVSGPFVQTILVEAHVTPAPAYLSIISGDNATGAVGAALPPLQVVVLDANHLPLQGALVNFAVIGGGGSLSARSVPTDSSGMASTILTLPPNPGTVWVVASSGEISSTFSATAIMAPSLLSDAVVDGVTFNAYTSIGRGGILSIFVPNLAQPGAVANTTADLPTSLQDTRVLLAAEAGDIALPLISVFSRRIIAVAPPDLPPGVYKLRIEVGSSRSNNIQISITSFGPGIFTQNNSGRGPGIFMKGDGSEATSSNPAERGSIVTFFASGLGPVDPPIAAGQPGALIEPLNRTITNPRVFFDIYPAELVYSGLDPGVAGRYQVTVRVPTLVSPATNVSVSLTIGGFASNRVTIPVQ
ncbi:MAG: hypothetical protein HY646_07485 [Acidobacteria bacterium]|nr:hypothetical protein [Acidobacteriota bacterium]